MQIQREKDIKQLNTFMRGERAAVETYTQCIKSMDDPAVIGRLRKLRASHRQRVRMLSKSVEALGGEPADSSSVWGSFARLLEGGAKLLGKSAAIATLETGEEHGRLEYARELWTLSPDMRTFVKSTILPKQIRTHDALQTIQKQLK